MVEDLLSCQAVSGELVCELPEGHDSRHYFAGVTWGEGGPVSTPFVYRCSTCGETFSGDSIADEPVCACHCIYAENATGAAQHPSWVRFTVDRTFSDDEVTEMLRRLGYVRSDYIHG